MPTLTSSCRPTVSLEALSDMRQIVGALREAAPPGLERLAELVESARAAGPTPEGGFAVTATLPDRRTP